jgi:hypothetical protein
MAKKKTSTKNRQPASSELPIWYSEVSAKSALSSVKASKKRPTKKKKQTPKNTPKPDSSPRKTKRSKKLTIPLGSKRKLVIELRQIKPKKLSKKQQQLLQKRRQKKLSAAVMTIGLIGVIFFSVSSYRSTQTPELFLPPTPQTVESVETKPVAPKTLPRSQPISLTIADLGIDTSIIVVGQNSDKTMQVPTAPDTTGWYELGPSPGELGPAIIVGHVDSPKGPAIFWRLRELQTGQIIEIKRSDEKTVSYKVDSVRQFDQDNFPTEDVYGNIDHVGLRLITCGGIYDRDVQRYSHNTVVFASVVE